MSKELSIQSSLQKYRKTPWEYGEMAYQYLSNIVINLPETKKYDH